MRRTLSLQLVALAVLAGPAAAQNPNPPPGGETFQYAWYRVGSFTPLADDANIIDADQGTELTLRLYLIQTGGTGNLLDDEDGLFSAGFRVTTNNAAVKVASAAKVAPNTGFESTPAVSVTNTPSGSVVEFSRLATIPAVPPPPSDVGYDAPYGGVFIASLTFDLAAGSGGTTVEVIAGLIPGDTTHTVTATTGYVLDGEAPVFISDRSVFITPTPEPASVLGVAAAGLGLAGWVRRRRRPSTAGDAADNHQSRMSHFSR